jgi:TonB-dependent SusC/RagA subfamily outer membrane receptor
MKKEGSIIIAAVLLTGLLFLSLTTVILPDKPERIARLLETFYENFPQQKIYLSLDKPAYMAGQTIWYKAYVLDATTHLPADLSKNMIVEVSNSFGNNILTQLCKIENGYSRGDFHLPDTIAEGIYEIRAYTNWMRNFGDEFFFRRQFNVWNPVYASKIYRDDKIANKKLKKKSIRMAGKTDLQFFPEGGFMVAGKKCRIAFKACNELGLGIDIGGIIMDKKNKQVAVFSSEYLGMGAFEFVPEKDNSYTAEVRNSDGRTSHFKLPESLEEGYVLRVDANAVFNIKITVTSTYLSPEVMLLGHVRGKVFYTKTLKLESGTAVTEIDKSSLQTGIFHLTLFDQASVPQCERLVFINQNDQLNISTELNSKVYKPREKVDITLQVKDAENKPVRGSFNISVTDLTAINESSEFQSSAISYLLLASDLRGPVEEPDNYFSNNTAEIRQAADYLMMTQGWRRFVWENVTGERSLKIDYPVERGLVVSGRITREIFDIPLKNLPVTLTVLSEFNDVFITRTDSKGAYSFELPDYEDTVFVEITCRRLNGRKNLVIYLDESDRPETGMLFSPYTKDMAIQGSKIYRPVEEPEKDTNQVRLEGIYSRPDNVIYVDEALQTYGSVLEIIQGRVPGVMVTGKHVLIRGISTLYGSTEPLYLIDNVPVDVEAIQSLSPLDVERIEILKGPSTAIYGSRGGNGVISVYTRRGTFMRKGVIDFKMFGYHRAREFYSPKFGTEYDHLIPDERSTIYWDPMVGTDENGKATISFYNSDRTGTFWIVVEGVSDKGTPGKAEESYVVQ